MTAVETRLRAELVKWIPNLRAFALSLTQSAQHSDDLVQDTLVKALSNLDKFQEGTNMRAWMFTILRNSFFNDIRYQKYHQTAPLDDVAPSALETRATQEKFLEYKDVLKAWVFLPRNNGKHSSSSPPRAFLTKTQPRYANARSAPSKAGLAAHAAILKVT